jgi:hypothetical protein
VIAASTALAASSQAIRPPSQIVSYDEYADLLRSSASRIPDLQDLWTWQKQNRRTVYVGGGLVRGLIHWVTLQLQTHTPAEIRALPVPSTQNLLIQEGSDLDLIGKDQDIKKLKKDLPRFYDSIWDRVPEKFRELSIRAGGATIEKTALNPSKIDDPLDGLKDAYEGRLTFRWVSDRDAYYVPRNFPTANNRTVVALRYLRMTQDLPELQSDPTALEHIRQIASLEGKRLVQTWSSKGGLKEPTVERYFLLKALRKLYDSTHGDLAKTAQILKDANLLHVVAKAGYFLKPKHGEQDNGISLKSLNPADFRKLGFTQEELIDIGKLSKNPVTEITTWMSAVLNHPVQLTAAAFENEKIPENINPAAQIDPTDPKEALKFSNRLDEAGFFNRDQIMSEILTEFRKPGWQTNPASAGLVDQILASGKFDQELTTLIYLNWTHHPRSELWKDVLEMPQTKRSAALSLSAEPCPTGLLGALKRLLGR